MDDVIKWVMEHWLTVVLLSVALLNVLNGVLKLIPGDQGEQEGGWLSKTLRFLRGLLDRFSVLSSKDTVGVVKLPLTKSKAE